MGACFGKPMEYLMPPLDQERATASHSRMVIYSSPGLLYYLEVTLTNSKMCQTVNYLPAVMK